MRMEVSDKACQLIQLLEDAESIVDVGSRTVECIESVVNLVENSISALDQASSLVEQAPILLSEFSEFKNRSKKWDLGAPSQAVPETFSDRALTKQSYLSESLRKNALFFQDNGLSTGSQKAGFRFPLSILPTDLDPFCGLLLSTGVRLVDCYLTERAVRLGMEKVSTQLATGFSSVSSQLDKISLGIEDISVVLEKGLDNLSMQFTWGISELIWRTEESNDLFRQIHETLNRPLETESRELKNRGITSYNRGWYDEALIDLLEAEKKSRVDFIVDHYIGNIYLFSEDHLDYTKAIEYYRKAAKYAEPESNYHAILALIHLGLAHYLLAKNGDLSSFKQSSLCLEKAISIAKKNYLLSSIPELLYQHAQYSALAGEHKTALALVSSLLADHPTYLLKIIAEEDFLVIKHDVIGIVNSIHADLKTKIEEFIDRYRIFLEIIGRDNSGYYDSTSMDLFLVDLQSIVQLYLCGDFISLSAATRRLSGIQIPISHPRTHVNRYYIYTGKFPYYIYSETRDVSVYPTPYEYSHSYKEAFFAIGGDLL